MKPKIRYGVTKDETASQIKQMAAKLAAGMVSTITDNESYNRLIRVAGLDGLSSVREWITESSVKQAISIHNKVDEIVYDDDTKPVEKNVGSDLKCGVFIDHEALSAVLGKLDRVAEILDQLPEVYTADSRRKDVNNALSIIESIKNDFLG